MPTAKSTAQTPEGAPEQEFHTDETSIAMRDLGNNGNPLLTEEERSALFDVVVAAAMKGSLSAAQFALNRDDEARKVAGKPGRPRKEPEPAAEPSGPRPVSIQDKLAARKKTGRPASHA